MQSDEFLEIVLQVKAGDTRRFLEAVEPFFVHLKRLTRSMLPNAADSEEVVQETILKALQHIDQLREVQCLKGWLFQIAVNEARLRMRGNRRFETGPAEELPDEAADSGPATAMGRLADKGTLPFEIVETTELLAAARRSIHALEPNYREVFVLRDVQGLGVRETAMILSVSEACVHTRLHRARLQLRKLMAPYLQPACAKWKPLQIALETASRYKNKVVSCRKVLDELARYLDKTIHEQVRQGIEARLKYCSRCALMVDPMEKVIYLLADEEIFAHPFECKNRWENVREAFSSKRV
jgi:RNA polymerase sigma-70 factor (ECF subfamily)